MEINNDFLKYTIVQKNAEASIKEASLAAIDGEKLAAKTAPQVANIDTVQIAGKTQDVSGVMSDEEYVKEMAKLRASASKTSSLVTLYSDLSNEDVQKIKEAIYAYYHPDETPDPEPIISMSYTFIDSSSNTFKGTDALVDYLKEANVWDNERNGIPVANLVRLAQNDDLEDGNRDFFGNLNRAFQLGRLNTDGLADFISYEELVNLFNEINSGSETINLNTYANSVNAFSDELQLIYDNLDTQGKLEFAIQKTREYLIYAGLTNQLRALERLLGMTDNYNSIHVGQIALADLNPNGVEKDMTLGAYDYYILNEKVNYKGYSVAVWYDDQDDDGDFGLTLDYRLVEGAEGYNFGHWYDLVNTLVHELTHASAYLFYNPENNSVNINELANATGYSVSELQSMSEEKLYFLAYTAWGEYSAYQADADYWDSIGGDTFLSDVSTAVDGKNEKGSIYNHVKKFYPGEPYPEEEWKWWSYDGTMA